MRDNRTPLYVLNGFLKFEKKIYQIMKLPLGRPIKLKTVGYFFAIVMIEILIYMIPGVGHLIRWIPPIILFFVLPLVIAWVLSDVGTEDRSPISYFRSFFSYHYRKIRGNSYFRGREVQKKRNYQFHNYFTYVGTEETVDVEEKENEKKALREQEKTLKYIERITDPDTFFERIRKEKEALERRRKWLFWKRA